MTALESLPISERPPRPTPLELIRQWEAGQVTLSPDQINAARKVQDQLILLASAAFEGLIAEQ